MLSLNCIFAFLFVLANTRCLGVFTSERSSYRVWTPQDEELARDRNIGRIQYKSSSSSRYSASPSSSQASKDSSLFSGSLLPQASRGLSARSPFYSNSRKEDAELNERVGSLFNSIDQNQDGFMDSLELTRASHANNLRITEAEARPAANVAFNKAKFGDLLSLSPSSKPTDLLHFLIHATRIVNRPRNIGFRTLPPFSDLKKELHLKLQHVFLYLDVDHNCVLEVSDLVSIFNDIERPISAEIAGNLLTVDSEALVGVDFNHWRTSLLYSFTKSDIGQYWREVFEDVEKIFGGALPPVTDTAIQKAAKLALGSWFSLARRSKLECLQINLVNVQAAGVKGRDEGVEYSLELRVSTKSGSNCEDQVFQVVKVVVLKPLSENCLDASSLRLLWGQISSEIICAPDELSSRVCSCEAGVGGARTVCTANQGCTSAGTCQDACIPNQENSGGCMCKDSNSNSGVVCQANLLCTPQGTCVAACTAGETNSAECLCVNAGVCSAGQGCGQDGSCVDVCSTDKINSAACFCKLSSIGNSGTTCSAGKGCDAGTCIDVCTSGEKNAASCFCKTSPTGDSGKACSANQGCTDTGECLDVCDPNPDPNPNNVCFCEGANNQGVQCTAICDYGKCYEASSFPGNKCFLEHLFQYNIGTNQFEEIRIPKWTITVEGTTLSQIVSARPSVGITQLGDPAKSASFKGEIYSDDDTDGDVLGMVFGFNDTTNFFVVASSRDEPGPTNWYVGRVHATCGVSCHNTKDISSAIWKPSDHPSEITVLKQGDSHWLAGKRYVFSICFNPAELLLDVTVTQKDTGAVVLDTAGKVTAATGKTAVDDISRKSGFIGVYVDSQKQAHWTALECSSCDIPACVVGVNSDECFCSDGANGGTLCAAGKSCDGAGSCVGCLLAQLDVATSNAINNNLLGFVRVTLSQDGKFVDRLTTDQTAKGQFNSPHGLVVLTAELDGFVMAPVLLRVGSNECEKMIKLSLSPEYTGAARVVMNWGRNPQDLDLHVKQLRNGQEVCHSYFNNKNCGGFALDVDNRLGGDNGAETMTFTELDADSEYIVYVYDYSVVKDTPSYLPASQSRVAFYREGYAPTQISVPTTETDPLKKWWMVACFNYKGEFVGTNRNLLMSSVPTECSPSERFLRIPSRQHPDF